MEGMPLQWLQAAPPVTRAYVISSVVLSLTEALGYIKISDFAFNKPDILSIRQLWKIPLNLIYNGKFSFDFCMKLFFFSSYSNWLETSINSSRNFLWMILILVILINIYSLAIINLPMIGQTFKETLLYIWTKNNTQAEGLFLFIAVKTSWLPWLSFIFKMALLGPRDRKLWLIEIAGIIIGHLYWFINEMIPVLNNCQSPFTPIWDWKLIKGDQKEGIEEEGERDGQIREGEGGEQEQPQQQIEDTPQLVEELHDIIDVSNDINRDVDLINYEEETINPIINNDYQRESDNTLHQR